MAIFSYFLAVLAHFHLHVLIKWRLVEAFTVLATIYTLFAIALVLCLAGSKIFGFIAIFFDILFIAAFIGVAWLTRHGAYQCHGLVRTPVGDGQASRGAFGIINFAHLRPSLGDACILNRVVFALSIILIFLFLATAILQLLMSRSKKDKRYASNEKDYNNTARSSKTPIWKRNRHPDASSRSRSSSHRRSHRDRDLAAAGVAAPVAARAVSGRRSGESGSTLDGDNYNREPKHHESGFDRPGHTPITARGHHGHHNARDDTYPDGTLRNNPNDPLHSVTVHSPTTTTTTTTHMPADPVRTSSRGRRGAPGYTQEDASGNTHVPGHNNVLTQQTPYHEITTEEQREAALRNQNAGLGHTGYNQNMTPGQPGYGQNTVGQREYHDTTRGQNILPGHGVNTIGNQREFDNRGQPGYDQNLVGNQRDYDNTNLGRRDITPGRDRDITPGRVRDITPGRNSNRNTLVGSGGYDNTNLGQTDYGRDNTLGRDRDITPGRDQTGYNITNQRDFDNRGTGFNPNTNQGYNDNYNRDSSFNRTPSAGRVRRF